MPPKKNTFRAPIKAQSEAKLGLNSGAKPYEKKDSHSSADSSSHDSKYNNASINGNDSIGYEDNTLNPHPIFKRAKPLDRNETANKTIENGTNDTVTLGNRTAHDGSATQDGRVSQDVGGNTQNDRVKQDDVTEETPMQAMDTQESTIQNMEETVQDTSTQEIFTQESINEVTLTQQSRTDVVTQQSPLQAMDTEESTVQDTFTQKSTMQGTFTHARFLCGPLEKETSKVKHETQGDTCLDETAMEEETPVNETEEVKPLNEIGESKLKPLDEIEEAKPLNEADEGMFLKATSTSSNQQDPSSSLRVAKSSQETLSNGIPKSCTKKTKATPAKKIKETPNNNAIPKPTIKRNKEALGKRNETPTKRMKKTPSKPIKEALIKTIKETPSKAIKETPNNGIQESPMPMTPLKVSQLTNPDRVFTLGTSEVTNQDRPSVHEVSTGTPEVNHENSTDVNETPRTAEVNRNSSQQALAPSTPTANNCNRSDEELAGTPEPGTPFTPFTNPFTPLTNPFTPIEITPLIHTPSQQTEGAISDTPSRYDTLQSSVLSQDSLPCSQNSLRKNLLMNTRRPEVIKCVLATCPPSLNQKERLLWLQEKRCVGIWAMCNLCTSYRFLPDVYDPCTLPQSGWRCSLYPGLSCNTPVEEPSALEEEHFILDAYNAGSVVWAKLDQFPWWPAMIDDDPELEIFYWLDGLSDKPLKYHVTFFDSKEVSRAWISASNIKRYEPRRRSDRSIPTALRPRYNTAQDQAIQAVGEKDLLKRLRRWSFVARYRGEIRPPKPEEELMPLIRRFMRQDPSKL